MMELKFKGNLTGDPEMRTFQNGNRAVANFSVAHTPRTRNRDTDQWEDDTKHTTYIRCQYWDAEQAVKNFVDSVAQGDTVVGWGTLRQEAYTDKDGNDRISYQQVVVDEVAPSTQWNSMDIHRKRRGNSGSNNNSSSNSRSSNSSSRSQSKPQSDPFGSDDTNFDEPPF